MPCPCARPPLAAPPHTYMRAPQPRLPPLRHTLINLHTCLPCPRARLRCGTPRYTYVHASQPPRPSSARARPPLAAHPDTHTNIPALHPDIHSFGTQGSVCFTPTHTYVRCIHALQSGVAVGTPSNPAGHFELLAAQTPALLMPLILPRHRRGSYIHARS